MQEAHPFFSSGLENFRKIINILCLTTGMLIFSGVILLRVEVWAHKTEAEVQQQVADLDWQGFQYHRTAAKVLLAE
jgi:hypothetical protein